MKKHVALTLLILTTLGVLRAHVDIERQDGRYFLSLQGKKHDLVGAVVNQSNRLFRQCSAVQQSELNSPSGSSRCAKLQSAGFSACTPAGHDTTSRLGLGRV
jgi:hypothetical protein